MDTKNLLDSFRSRIQVKPSGCWEWTGARDSNGYGRFGQTTAHRVSCAVFTGSDIKGHHVHHLCNNPPCVNPSHLVAITEKLHTAVTVGGTGYRNARVSHCPSGHPYDDINGYRHPTRRNRLCRKCHAVRNKALANSHPGRPSPYPDVSWSRLNERWKVELSVSNNKVFFGYYDDESEAVYVCEQVISQLR